MTMASTPWCHPQPTESRLHLDVVPSTVIHALAAGSSAALTSGYASPYLAGHECIGLWQRRSKQIIETPTDAPWITRVMVHPGVARPLGAAGFHSAPDETGMVEIGYRVDPEMRRQGWALRSVETLLAVARRHQDVHTVRATISPTNAPSLGLIGRFAFVAVGEQWDDEDGLEIIYEMEV